LIFLFSFEKYQQENKEIILVGIEFSKEKRNIKEYAFEKISLNNKT
jgi:hypothetical protein